MNPTSRSMLSVRLIRLLGKLICQKESPDTKPNKYDYANVDWKKVGPISIFIII